MYRNLFTAWYCLGVLALCLAAYLILLPFIGIHQKGTFGLLGLLGFLPFFWFVLFRKEKNDERDLSFMQRSVGFGFASGVATFFLTNTVLFFFCWSLSDSDVLSIPVHVFWAPSNCGVAVGILSASLMLILFYRKGEHADKEGCNL
jgi:hypothetical protein